MEILPRIPSIAVFDTSFHSTIPEKAYTYPLPSSYRDLNMRKFGFHGTSVQYVSHLATAILKKNYGDKDFNMVVCHLGSGASVTAVVGEKVRVMIVYLLDWKKRQQFRVTLSSQPLPTFAFTEHGYLHGIHSPRWFNDGHSLWISGSITCWFCMRGASKDGASSHVRFQQKFWFEGHGQ